MAPQLSKKRKSTHSHASDATPAKPSNIEEGQSRTPTGSPARKKMRITLSQKQALIDNLQLEITDRARRLRSTASHQAKSLRSRIETRVNRIPRALRKATMGELLAKYATMTSQNAEIQPSTVSNVFPTGRQLPAIPQEIDHKLAPAAPSPARARGVKRSSDDMLLQAPADSDGGNKENDNDHQQDQPPLSNPKKRSKPSTTAMVARPKSRAASRTTKPTNGNLLNAAKSNVLSPKSPNSRTYPRPPISPSRPSPTKSLIARPVSPLKPASPLKATTLMVGGAVAASLAGMVEHAKNAKEKARKISPRGLAEARKEKKTTSASTATAARQPRKGANNDEAVQHDRTVSNSSNTSSGTTVVTKSVGRKPVATKKAVEAKAAAKGAGAATAAATAAAAKRKAGPAPVEVPATGRRVLRKRA